MKIKKLITELQNIKSIHGEKCDVLFADFKDIIMPVVYIDKNENKTIIFLTDEKQKTFPQKSVIKKTIKN